MDSLKSRLARGESVNVCAVGRVFHYNLIQMLGVHGGFHGIWFDLEHVGNSIENLEIGTMAARAAGLDSFVRLAPTDYAAFSRSLECGASGVMAAQVRSAQEAEQIVRWCKFHPLGNRGLNNGGYDAGFGKLGLAEYCEKANRETLVIVQIENAEAIAECEAIAAVPGVDMLFMGPADLSQNLGVAGDFFHPKCLAAMDQISAACARAGKTWGVVTVNQQYAQLCRDKGCRMFSPANDVKLINAGINAIKQGYPDLFGTK